jgi:multidrug efflux pump
MVLSDLSIRRPVLATVMSIIIILLGIVSYTRLSVREYPKIEEPVVTVRTDYRGASAEIVESQVTKPLEESLAGIEGVDILTSTSRQERSNITVRFRLERDPDSAASDVRDRVARVRGRLPDAIEEPVIAKVEADASPVVWLAFSSDRHTPMEISDFANRIAKNRLQTLPGVAEVSFFGQRTYAMRIWLDRQKLVAYNVTVQDIEDALRRQNVSVPAGTIESRQREFSVTAETDLSTPAQFEAVVVRTVNGYSVRLGDVARVAIGPLSERTAARFNGRPAVGMGIIKQATANPLDLSRAVRNELPRVQADMPPGVQVQIGNDTSIFIERSIQNVYRTIIEAILLVALVIFIFLRSFRATLVPLVTIPVALIGSFGIMFALGFSINTLTLLAFVLAIGLVVDDAIVVLENIHRHIEDGMPRLQAALVGSKEIGFAVVAMTLTLASVYAPVAFMTGRTGKLFIEFALTLAGAVIVSGFVALTLSPMLCSKLLRHEERHGRFYNFFERGFTGLSNGYRRALGFAMTTRWMIIVLGLVVAAGSWILLKSMKSELAPVEDRGIILGNVTSPEGATIEYTSRNLQRMEPLIEALPEKERYLVIGGFPTVSQGVAFIGLQDWKDRERNSVRIAEELRPKMFSAMPGVQAFPLTPASLGQSARSKPVEFVIITSQSYQELSGVLDKIMADAEKNPNLVNLDHDLRLNKPEVRIRVDRDRAADSAVQVETVGRTLETLLGGRQVTRFKQGGEQYDVIVQLERSARDAPQEINDIFMRGRNDRMVSLSSLVSVQETVAPRELNHFAQRRSATISANLAAGYSIGEALAFMEETARRHLPEGAATDLAGQSREFRASSSGLAFTFMLALAFIYLVLAAQFESFIGPFVIMLTVPLAMAGALGALQLAGGTLNVYSQIGLVTLIGLITKHGILIVEFANQIRDKGRTVREAVVESAMLRLRPILMTTGAMVLGAVPLALATGAGAENRTQIGWVVVGGMLLGTVLTLFVVPVVYSLIAKERQSPQQESLPADLGGLHEADHSRH